MFSQFHICMLVLCAFIFNCIYSYCHKRDTLRKVLALKRHTQVRAMTTVVNLLRPNDL
jgi:hypothetical protein